MTRFRRRKPIIVQVSEHETLVVFPFRPGAAIGESCNLPFDQIKHLLSDKPLRPRYLGEPSADTSGKPARKRARKRSRKLTRRARHKPRG